MNATVRGVRSSSREGSGWQEMNHRLASISCDTQISGRVLIVDDDRTTRAIHRSILAKQFDVETVSSGGEALTICRERLPDLVLLDCQMPELDGFQTCKQLREWATIPIIFATVHQSLEEHLKAYDAGANDLITKPVNSKILLRKIAMAIRNHQLVTRLAAEKISPNCMPMSFLSREGESGTLLNFIRTSLDCRNHVALAEKILEASKDCGVQCSVLIRHANGPTARTLHGEPSPLERSILDLSSNLGPVFQFKSRLVVNQGRISIIVANMPDKTQAGERAGRIQENITILAEAADALCGNVDMLIASTRSAEQLRIALGNACNAVQSLRKKYLTMHDDVRMLLHDLVVDVERTYSWLGVNQSQESIISENMDNAIQRILAQFAVGSDFDRQFDLVLKALHGNRNSAPPWSHVS